MVISERLRGLREEKKLSQGDIEERTGVAVRSSPNQASMLTIHKRGRVFWSDGIVCGVRVRRPLGTRNSDAAHRIVGKLERVLAQFRRNRL